MKIGRITALAAMTLAVGAIDAAAVRGFGPASCVSVSRSSAGTCVLHTSCEGQDLSNFDFVFDCLGQKGRQTHSLGIGSFDTQEDYDTDLKCQECLPPQYIVPVVVGKPLAKSVSSKRAATHAGESLVVMSESRARLRAPTDENTPKAEWYGPESCVGVWRDDKSGACVMQTDCDKDVQLGVYEFGLVCVAEDEEMTRHIFGMGSFAHKETFNTLVKCKQCLALDEYMDGEKAVGALSKMVKGLKEDMKDVSGGVTKLNAEVFPPKAAGPAAAPAPGPAKPAKFLLSPPGRSVAHAAASTLSAPGRSVAAATANLVSPVPQQVVALVAPSPKSVKLPPPHPKLVVVVPPAPIKHQEVSEEAQGPTQVEQHVKRKHSQVVSSSAPVGPAPEASVQDILATAMKNAQEREGGVMGVAKTVLSKAQAAKLQATAQSAEQPQAKRLTAVQMQQQATQPQNIQYVVTEEKEKESDLDDDEDDHSKDEDDDDE